MGWLTEPQFIDIDAMIAMIPIIPPLKTYCNGNHGCNQCGESVNRTSSTHFTQS